MAKVRVFGHLRTLIGNAGEIIVEGETVWDIAKALANRFPELKNKLLKGNELSMQTMISVDSRDIRLLDNEKTRVDEKSVVYLLPSLVGG